MPGRAWTRTVELARQAEELGFEALWVFDHFHTVPEPTDEITFESFTVLAALAMATGASGSATWSSAPGSGTLPSPPSCASTIDVISGGRFELGIGAGWKEDEWLAYGYGFPPIGERMDAFGDDLEVIRAMFEPGPGHLRGRVRPRPRRDQRPEGHPAAAHPDHRRRQRRARGRPATRSASPTS